MERWRFIESETGSAQWNMAVDEALLYSFKDGDIPLLRLYQWTPSVSFGRFSHPKEQLDWQYLQKESISYVRRMTGGGILVHGGELSYTLVIPRRFVKQRGVKESYRFLCGFLIRLYRQLGLDAAFARDIQFAERQTDICLAGIEAYDIVIEERKIGGNAQRYTQQALLQHGTVPLHIDTSRFEPLFNGESGLSQAATLGRMGIKTVPETLKEALLSAFCNTFDTTVIQSSLSEDEQILARQLYEEKYTQEAWNIHGEN